MSLTERLLRKLPFGLARLPEHPYEAQFSTELDLPEVEKTQRIILIASTFRCGSHYLGHMLREHGGFGVPLEYLHRRSAAYWARRFGTEDIHRLFLQFLRFRTSSNGTFVTKAHWSQFEPFADRVESLTRGIGIEKIVWIYRRSLLAQAVSLVIASQTGVWISGAKPTGEAKYNFEAIVWAAESIKRENAAWKEYLLARYPDRTIVVAYEELLKPESPDYRKLRSFLELANELRPSERTQRQHSSVNSEWKSRFIQEKGREQEWILQEQHWEL